MLEALALTVVSGHLGKVLNIELCLLMLIYCGSGFGNLFSRMDRNRSFYCHRCNQQVRINLEEWQCAECQSGFVEELPAQLKLKNISQII